MSAVDAPTVAALARDVLTAPGVWNPTTVELARAVSTLLDERDSGRRLAEDRFDAEMAETRDEIHTVARAVAQLQQVNAVALDVSLLEHRVNSIAKQVEAHGELLGQHSYTLATHSMRLSGREADA